MTALNSVLNRIHEWSQPENNPLKRFFGTRIAAVAPVSIEACHLVSQPLFLGLQALAFSAKLPIKAAKLVLDHPKLNQWEENLPGVKDIVSTAKKIAYYFVGILSSALFGILSPELNFRIHLKLGLADDLLAVRKKRDLEAILSAQNGTVQNRALNQLSLLKGRAFDGKPQPA